MLSIVHFSKHESALLQEQEIHNCALREDLKMGEMSHGISPYKVRWGHTAIYSFAPLRINELRQSVRG